MSDTDSSYHSDESSDSDDSTLLHRIDGERKERFKLSNLFFSSQDCNEKDVNRSIQIYKRSHYEKGLTKDKRTTVQQVLDKRTYVRLRKLCGQGVFHYLHGVISAGKEANVFEAEILPEAQLEAFKSEIIAIRNAKKNESCLTDEIEQKLKGVLLSNGSEVTVMESTTDPGESVCQKEEGNYMAQISHYTNHERPIPCSNDDLGGRVAIKIYKTSILIFKDRSRYIEGEFRFRRAYVGTKNPRKMVSQWAEKEFRNLRRIALSGLYSPAPIALKEHVLVMELLANNDKVAPKLENLGALPLAAWQTIYTQTICIMRTLFQECKLIHGDFSSFNMLYSNGRVYVIDTSQALENDHLNAMPFLKRDCENVTKFFESVDILQPGNTEDDAPSIALRILTPQQLFCFIVSRKLGIKDTNKNMEFDQEHLFQDLLDDDSFLHVKNFWSLTEQQARLEVSSCLEKMTRFNKLGFSHGLTDAITTKRMSYLDLCRETYIFLTGPIFANEESRKTVPWLRELNFDKQLPLNMSQVPLETAESVIGKTENVVVAMNELSDNNPSEDETDEHDSVDGSDDGSGTCSQVNNRPKFTGKIPDTIDPREWKKMVKEHNRERRKHKIPKHIKKKGGNRK